MAFILPAAEQVQSLLARDYKGPIIMVNLLKFKPDGGEEMYQQYYQGTMDLMMGKAITRKVYRGAGLQPVIGDEEWDEIALYEYPSIQAFIEMARDEEYQKVIPLRTEALLDSRLYCTIPKGEE
jgi:uncharacterized protein (DUF1330 family)